MKRRLVKSEWQIKVADFYNGLNSKTISILHLTWIIYNNAVSSIGTNGIVDYNNIKFLFTNKILLHFEWTIRYANVIITGSKIGSIDFNYFALDNI